MQGSLDFDVLWPGGISEPMVWRGDVFFNFAKYITWSSPMFDYQEGRGYMLIEAQLQSVPSTARSTKSLHLQLNFFLCPLGSP